MDHNNLVGAAITILKNGGVRQWGWDDIPYMKWKTKNVPNHQPVITSSSTSFPRFSSPSLYIHWFYPHHERRLNHQQNQHFSMTFGSSLIIIYPIIIPH